MTLWKEIGGWTYRYFGSDIDPSSVPKFESLMRVWQSKRNGRRVPAWADFDFYDFVGWHGRLTIFEISYDPLDYRVRLSGVDIDNMYGRTMTGLTRKGLENTKIEHEDSSEFYFMTCTNLLISNSIGPVNLKGREHIEVEFLELPLSDDGIRATHSIEAAVWPRGR